MTRIADEIREATARSELHPLVARCVASPRGLCNESRVTRSGAVLFCTLDYGHKGPHVNDYQEAFLDRRVCWHCRRRGGLVGAPCERGQVCDYCALPESR